MKNIQTWRDCFPIEPVPDTLFIKDKFNYGEFCLDINQIFSGKLWSEVTLDDWTRLPYIPVIKMYMQPYVFHYYLPSLLYQTCADDRGGNYLEYIAEALLPNNAKREVRGEWWSECYGLFTAQQKALIKIYLTKFSGDSFGNGYMELALEKHWHA